MTAPKHFEIGTDLDEALAFVAKHYQPLRYVGQTALTLKKRGHVVAAALYDGYTGGNINVQVAGTPGIPWLTRAAIGWAFAYPFVQLGCERLSAWIEIDNEPSCRFAEKLGFKLEHTLPRAGREAQAVCLYRMFKEECRYV